MIRKIAHTLVASAFIVDGVQTLRNPKEHAGEAKAVIGPVRSVLPPQYAKAIPTDGPTQARILGGTKVAASALVATNKAPRLGALVLAAIQIPTTLNRNAFWSESDKNKKQQKQTGFLTDATLLGGLLVTSMDTQGKPSVAWRVKKAMPGKSEQEKMLANAQDRSKELAETAQAQASDFFGTAKEKVAEVAQTVSEYVDDNKDDWKESALDFRDQATEKASELRDQAADFGSQASAYAQEQGKAARERAQEAQKQGRKELKKARKEAKKAAKKYNF
ncbi:DoxX family membrane protein [Corynebacterium sp. 319]|uniref:DoxX family membrane protein n=1 Tax=unclassified Corynebacterium TaxID=2624378 RepID=UPI00125CC215|nr:MULTISPECIES: DoxX family membrane protein [unclassified Corynebacterium]KAB1551961.1 DoxX family membrane protein [Corynebacterium sp. 319]KAB3538955.1 DoxX family membrane protein [Corynebacterium sp. 366]